MPLRGLERVPTVAVSVISGGWDIVQAHVARMTIRALTGSAARLRAVTLSFGLAAVALWLQWSFLAPVFAMPGLYIAGARVWGRLERRRRLRVIARKHYDPSRLTPADEILPKMGIDEPRAAALLKTAREDGERVIAELDQNNRVVSHIGPIPLFEGSQVAPDEFRGRSRNRMQIVLVKGTVAMKKRYRDYASFCNEAVALDALEDLDGTPKIVEISVPDRAIHQSFIPGRNLGSLLARRGVSVSSQYTLSKRLSQSSRPQAGEAAVEYPRVARLLREITSDRFLKELQNLITRIHQAGVALHDVKYGNVLIYEDRPHLCDFDLARLFRRNSMKFVLTRERERTRFNALFGGAFVTQRDADPARRGRRSNAPGSEPAPPYIGKGYGCRSFDGLYRGLARWSLLRRHLPSVRGKRVLALGAGDSAIALSMLREGARAVWAIEPADNRRRLARLAHGLVEFVDNRSYDFTVTSVPPTIQALPAANGFGIGIVRNGVLGNPTDHVERVQSWLANVEILLLVDRECDEGSAAVQVGPAPADLVRSLLDDGGFARPKIIDLGHRGGRWTIARKARP